MDTEKRVEVFATRLTESEARTLKERAKQQDMSVSDLIRGRLFPESKQPKPENVLQVK